MFRKKTVLDDRIRRVEEELAQLNRDIRAVSKGKRPAALPVPARRGATPPPAKPASPKAAPTALQPVDRDSGLPAWPGAGSGQQGLFSEKPAQGSWMRPFGVQSEAGRATQKASPTNDHRFKNYLASSFSPTQPLRRERRIQRNKAIAMVIVAVVVFFWVVSRFFR
jgi:hypothetical protein